MVSWALEQRKVTQQTCLNPTSAALWLDFKLLHYLLQVQHLRMPATPTGATMAQASASCE
jgi:hypothetical protein